MRYKIKAVIFDVGGVLQLEKYSENALRGHRELNIHTKMAKKFKVSLDQWFDSLDTPYSDSIEGKISRKKAISIISKNLKTTPKKLETFWVKIYKKNFKKNKDLLKFAYNLKKQGYKISILSDQWYLSKDALIGKFKKNFYPTIISCDVGIRKPNPKIYKLVLKKLKLRPQETVYIDNQSWNLKPAKKLGMKTILYKDNKQTKKDLNRLLK